MMNMAIFLEHQLVVFENASRKIKVINFYSIL